MTIEVEFPSFVMSDIDPDLPPHVHPAFIGPDGVVVESIKMEMDPCVALCALRNLRNVLWNKAKDMIVFAPDRFCTDLKEYDETTWKVQQLGAQIEKITKMLTEKEG